VISLAVAVFLALGAIAAIAYVAQGAMIFPRSMAGPPLAEAPEGVERVWVETESGERVEAWYLRGDGRTPDAPGPAVIYFHGNAELIDQNAARVGPYVEAGFGVLLVEYRGDGRSGGTPSQRGIVRDAQAFLAWLVAREEVDASRVVYHGRSLGAGVAAQLAALREPAALVMESAFTSVPALVRFAPLRPLVRHPFRSDRVLPTLSCPVLLLHGTGDTLIPPSHSETLAALTPNARVELMPGGHNDFPRDPGAFWETVVEFVAEAVSRPPAASD